MRVGALSRQAAEAVRAPLQLKDMALGAHNSAPAIHRPMQGSPVTSRNEVLHDVHSPRFRLLLARLRGT